MGFGVEGAVGASMIKRPNVTTVWYLVCIFAFLGVVKAVKLGHQLGIVLFVPSIIIFSVKLLAVDSPK